MPDSPDAVVGDMNDERDGREGGCPVVHDRAPEPVEGGGNRGWWPNRLNLKILAKNPAEANPMGGSFDYAAEFETLDLDAVKADINEVLTTSQDWWPADFGNYGPLMIRRVRLPERLSRSFVGVCPQGSRDQRGARARYPRLR